MTKQVSVLAERAALKISGYIEKQVEWIGKQEEVLADTVLGKDVSQYDLRQIVAGIKTGKETLSYLKLYFEQFVGMTYDEYCEQHPEIAKIETPEEKLLQLIKEIVKEGK